MLSENYPYMIFNQEMRRVYRGGTLGKVLFAEGEYNHPLDPENAKEIKQLRPYAKHWRNFLPRTYYVTHSLAPLMYITGSTPVRVTAMPVFDPYVREGLMGLGVGDRAAIITCLNDDDSVFRVTGCASFGGGHHNFTRICGTNGQVENFRGSLGAKLLLRYDPHTKPAGRTCETIYEPEWGDQDEALIVQSGHGGGDFITARMFVECIKEGKQPEHPFDIYSAVTMSSVAILGHRSVLAGGKTFDIPDFQCHLIISAI
jgi:predicted dehydrogenase